MIIFMLSLAGIPPTAGFLAKLAVFSAAVDSDLAYLAVCGVIATMVRSSTTCGSRSPSSTATRASRSRSPVRGSVWPR